MVGPDFELMVDANQRIPVGFALEWIEALLPYAPVWVEEPVAADRHHQMRSLRHGSSLPIAGGESETEPCELADLVAQEVVDVIQPDVHRVGLSAARAICQRSSAANVVVAPLTWLTR